MNVASKRTGLSQHVIRVWERRYSAVVPERTEKNRRLYSDEDIARLILLRQLTEAGHSISSLARFSNSELETLKSREVTIRETDESSGPEGRLVQEALRAVKSLDRPALEETLRRGAVALGAHGLLERVVAPLTDRLGEMWRTGELTAAHEHFASAVIRVFLGSATRGFAPGTGGPDIIVTTPTGQLHELGAVMVAAAAADIGWHVTYLGTSLPPEEIAAAAAQNKSKAVALSIVYPEDDERLPAELTKLRNYLAEEVVILAGGRAARCYAAVLDEIRAVRPGSLQNLYEELNKIRRTGAGNNR